MLSEGQLKVLIHKIEAKIPDRITEYYKNPNHRKMIAVKYGADRAFLDAENLKFVLVDPANGKYDCKLVILAIFKALWNCHRITKKPKSYYVKMLKKGQDIYKEIGCHDILDDKFNLPNSFDIKDLQA
jgi:hypothetical protein